MEVESPRSVTEKETNSVVEEELDKTENSESEKQCDSAVKEAKEVQVDEVEVLTKLTQQIDKFKEDLQRERAEFINYRKRVIQEKSEMEGSIIAKLIDTMLPALDAFEQLFSSAKGDGEKNIESFIEGAGFIQKQLIDAFQKYGVEEFNPEGEDFDPGSMEALQSQESREVSSDRVNEVYQKGYKIGGRLIRAARVSVIKPLQETNSKNNKIKKTNEKGR